MLRQIKHPLPVLSGSNPQENLQQSQTAKEYGRALRAWPARVQSDNVWREATSLIFHFSLQGLPTTGQRPLSNNHSTIVRGLIGRRMLVFVYESTRNSCTEHTEASGRSRSLAGGACRRFRDRPDLRQPARTRVGGPERHGARKTSARPLLKYRRVFQGTAPRRGTAEAIEGWSAKEKVAVSGPLRLFGPTMPVAGWSPDRPAARQTRPPHPRSHQRTPHPASALPGSAHAGLDHRPPP